MRYINVTTVMISMIIECLHPARMLVAENIRVDYDKYKGSFYVQNERLMELLEQINQDLQKEIDRNHKLIKLLKEVNNEYSRKR
jgi:hypothetical protein